MLFPVAQQSLQTFKFRIGSLPSRVLLFLLEICLISSPCMAASDRDLPSAKLPTLWFTKTPNITSRLIQQRERQMYLAVAYSL